MKKSVNKTILNSAGIYMLSILASCTAVKPYQKNKISDAEMNLSSRKVQKFEQSFQLYREGGSGANGGKSGGGCGCN